VPTITGVVERLRVRGLAARIHDDKLMKIVSLTRPNASVSAEQTR